ncbi:MAG: PD-(D/E)XK motif protein [Luteolibacter sp.]
MSNPWLVINRPTSDFNVRLVDNHHPLLLYWGVDARNRYLFVYDGDAAAMPELKSLPNLSGITMAISKAGERAKLVLILNETVNWELFHALCSDLVRATAQVSEASHGPSIVLRRLKRWQDFLKKERSELLPMEKIKGLIGELLFLTEPVAAAFGWDDAITFWKGPEDAPQDFAIHETAVEVKCQSGGSKPSVRITSVEQLNPQLPEAYLVVYTIATASGEESVHFNLNSLVDAVREKLGTASDLTRERFEDLLYLAGYVSSEKYLEWHFTKIAVKCFKIAEGFPRILPSSVPEGVDAISYVLQLDACAGFAEKPHWWKTES